MEYSADEHVHTRDVFARRRCAEHNQIQQRDAGTEQVPQHRQGVRPVLRLFPSGNQHEHKPCHKNRGAQIEYRILHPLNHIQQKMNHPLDPVHQRFFAGQVPSPAAGKLKDHRDRPSSQYAEKQSALFQEALQRHSAVDRFRHAAQQAVPRVHREDAAAEQVGKHRQIHQDDQQAFLNDMLAIGHASLVLLDFHQQNQLNIQQRRDQVKKARRDAPGIKHVLAGNPRRHPAFEVEHQKECGNQHGDRRAQMHAVCKQPGKQSDIQRDHQAEENACHNGDGPDIIARKGHDEPDGCLRAGRHQDFGQYPRWIPILPDRHCGARKGNIGPVVHIIDDQRTVMKEEHQQKGQYTE